LVINTVILVLLVLLDWPPETMFIK
jgi:hypothetical protein